MSNDNPTITKMQKYKTFPFCKKKERNILFTKKSIPFLKICSLIIVYLEISFSDKLLWFALQL